MSGKRGKQEIVEEIVEELIDLRQQIKERAAFNACSFVRSGEASHEKESVWSLGQVDLLNSLIYHLSGNCAEDGYLDTLSDIGASKVWS